MITKLAVGTLAAALALASAAGVHPPPARALIAHHPCASIVGSWYVDAVGAPFAPHVAMLHADSTMVMANPDAAEKTNSSSAGMGAWRSMRECTVAVQFLEVNADKASNAFTGTLIVTGQLTITGDDAFTGPVKARYYNSQGQLSAGPFPATLNGQRIGVGTPAPRAST
jgi:hypothetical protein